MTEKTIITYSPIKIKTKEFSIEYFPPDTCTKIAMIDITITGDIPKHQIALIVEKETIKLTKKYPITTRTTVYDEFGEQIDMTSTKPTNYFICYFNVSGNFLKSTWHESPPPTTHYYEIDTAKYFDDYKVIKIFDPDENMKQFKQQIFISKIIMFLWFIIIPVTYELVNFFGPQWVSIIVGLYSLYKIFVCGLKIFGKIKYNKTETEEKEIQRKKDHYFYHCEKNPDLFNKLKKENLKQENNK